MLIEIEENISNRKLLNDSTAVFTMGSLIKTGTLISRGLFVNNEIVHLSALGKLPTNTVSLIYDKILVGKDIKYHIRLPLFKNKTRNARVVDFDKLAFNIFKLCKHLHLQSVVVQLDGRCCYGITENDLVIAVSKISKVNRKFKFFAIVPYNFTNNRIYQYRE